MGFEELFRLAVLLIGDPWRFAVVVMLLAVAFVVGYNYAEITAWLAVR